MTTLINVRKNNIGIQWLLAALVVIVLGAIAWTFWVTGRGGSTGNDGLANARAQWAEQQTNDYRYTLQISCFCVQEFTRPVTIEVRGNQVRSIHYADDGTAADMAIFAGYDTIDHLFDILAARQAENPVQFDVTYDPATGVPTDVAIDISHQMADEELYFKITDFEPLS